MKKPMYLVLTIFGLLFVMLFASIEPVYAQRHVPPPHRGGVWVRPGWGPGWGPGWRPGWGPWWWGPFVYPYYDYPRPPVIIEQQPPVYDDQQIQQQEEPYYWYYCAESKTYYPYVKECPKGWMKVVPTPTPTPAPAQPKGGE